MTVQEGGGGALGEFTSLGNCESDTEGGVSLSRPCIPDKSSCPLSTPPYVSFLCLISASCLPLFFNSRSSLLRSRPLLYTKLLDGR